MFVTWLHYSTFSHRSRFTVNGFYLSDPELTTTSTTITTTSTTTPTTTGKDCADVYYSMCMCTWCECVEGVDTTERDANRPIHCLGLQP